MDTFNSFIMSFPVSNPVVLTFGALSPCLMANHTSEINVLLCVGLGGLRGDVIEELSKRHASGKYVIIRAVFAIMTGLKISI